MRGRRFGANLHRVGNDLVSFRPFVSFRRFLYELWHGVVAERAEQHKVVPYEDGVEATGKVSCRSVVSYTNYGVGLLPRERNNTKVVPYEDGVEVMGEGLAQISIA